MAVALAYSYKETPLTCRETLLVMQAAGNTADYEKLDAMVSLVASRIIGISREAVLDMWIDDLSAQLGHVSRAANGAASSSRVRSLMSEVLRETEVKR